jgi:hypothetical protein
MNPPPVQKQPPSPRPELPSEQVDYCDYCGKPQRGDAASETNGEKMNELLLARLEQLAEAANETIASLEKNQDGVVSQKLTDALEGLQEVLDARNSQ